MSGSDPTASLWRAAQVFRLASFGYALLASQLASYTNYERQGLSWALYAVMAMWTGFAAVALSRNWFRRWQLVLCDQVIVIALMLAGRLVVDVQWYSGHQTLPTTLWVANAVVSMGLLRGQLAGVISGFVLAVVSIAARGLPVSALWLDATMPALVVVGSRSGRRRPPRSAPSMSCGVPNALRQPRSSVNGCPVRYMTECCRCCRMSSAGHRDRWSHSRIGGHRG